MIKRITERFTPKEYLAEFLLGLTALFGLYLIVAWSSYTPLDNSWATAGASDDSVNKAGAFGAWVIDFFFVFFGYVANIVPFVLFCVPIYLLKTKAVKQLTLTRIALRLAGFVTLVIGLCVFITLLFPGTAYYLSGGVLGGSLVVNLLYPWLGKFGAIFVGILLTVAGFILCSGTSLIRLLVAFYHWLAMKNTQATPEEKPVSVEELEPIVIQGTEAAEQMTPSQTAESVSDNATQLEDNQAEAPVVNPLVQPKNLINISGLTPSVTLSAEDNAAQSMPESRFEPVSAMNEALPSVHISHESNVALPTQEDFIPVWNKPQQAPQNEAQSELQSAVDFPTVSLANNEPLSSMLHEDEMPSVSLPQSEAATETDNFDALAREFAAREAQRWAQADESVRLADDEPHFTVTIPSTNDERSSAPNHDEPVGQEEMAEHCPPTMKIEVPETPRHQGYSDSLIHPAFQQPTQKREKPTTPLPSLDLLSKHPPMAQNITEDEIVQTSHRIEQQLRNFGVKATVQDVLVGPVVTRYELELQPGVKASKVTGIDTDLARALMFRSIRVAEVIPGKPYIGIETPNAQRQIVPLRDVLDSNEFRDFKGLLPMALGKDISGKPVVVDLAKMPHLLVAGATGSGKSVGVNTMILSLLFRVQPEQVKFIMIDPKVVELSVYNDIPHLLTPVVTDMKKAANALRWCVDEMERRYQLLSALRVRNIEGFNEKIDEYEGKGMPVPDPIWRPGDSMDNVRPTLQKLSYIVVIVDEFADLMMVAGKQIEELIARLAQKARAIGIHLILATQRPSVDVITGLIKANVPSRIAFTVASKIDSRTILDQGGAEALLGRGDMLYSGQGSSDLVRIHGAFMSDDEVVRVADDWRARGKPDYIDGILESAEEEENGDKAPAGGDLDPLFDEVVEFVLTTGTTSVSSIQRKFSVGFNRAARIMDQMEEQGIVSAMQNGKREILARRSDY